jgi:hypothetical protein
MSARVEWDGDGAMRRVRERAARFLTRAAIEVTRRARELLSVAGTAQAIGARHALRAAAKAEGEHGAAFAAMAAENRAFARDFNERFRLQIRAGELKKLRVAKAGHLTDRAKAGSKKSYYSNVGGKMVRRRPKRKGF